MAVDECLGRRFCAWPNCTIRYDSTLSTLFFVCSLFYIYYVIYFIIYNKYILETCNFSLTKSFLSYSSLERLGHFDLVSLNEGFTFYKLYTVNFVMDFGFRRLRIETCGRPHQCKVQHDKHVCFLISRLNSIS